MLNAPVADVVFRPMWNAFPLLHPLSFAWKCPPAPDGIRSELAADWDVGPVGAPSCSQLGAMGDAGTAFAALRATPAVDSPGFWANLGVLRAAVCADPRAVWPGSRLDAHRYSRLDGPVTAPAPWPLPTVSVVMPAYMHAPFRRGYLATGESGAG